MRQIFKTLNTLLVVCWFMGTAMWMGGEPRGSLIEQIAVGFLSFALAYIYGREMARRDLLVTPNEVSPSKDNDNDWW